MTLDVANPEYCNQKKIVSYFSYYQQKNKMRTQESTTDKSTNNRGTVNYRRSSSRRSELTDT